MAFAQEKHPFRLLDLSGELRNRCYEFMLPSVNEVRIASVDKQPLAVLESPEDESISTFASLIQTSKQIRTEAGSIFYSHFKFKFSYAREMNPWLSQRATRPDSRGKSAGGAGGSDTPIELNTILRKLQKAKSLQTFELGPLLWRHQRDGQKLIQDFRPLIEALVGSGDKVKGAEKIMRLLELGPVTKSYTSAQAGGPRWIVPPISEDEIKEWRTMARKELKKLLNISDIEWADEHDTI